MNSCIISLSLSFSHIESMHASVYYMLQALILLPCWHSYILPPKIREDDPPPPKKKTTTKNPKQNKNQLPRTNHVYWWRWVEIHKQLFEVCQLHLLCFLRVPSAVWAVIECHHFRPLHFSRYLILNLKEIITDLYWQLLSISN